MVGTSGSVHAINVSDGGVPKQGLDAIDVEAGGCSGDRQRDLKYHGGPERAVCVLGFDVIERLQAEGHPINPGSTGENLTLAGVDWALLHEGSRLVFEGGVELQVTGPAMPCSIIAESFLDGEFKRMHPELCPGEARLYTRVLHTGRVLVGEGFRIESAEG
jgi:MOSC domain-containing protein YiiM